MSEAVILRRVDPGRNMARFYRMDIQADLFGEWCFVREWGRIGQAGQLRQAVYSSQAEARAALERQGRLKEKRGYVSVI
jgi:predicted DNA-binding WGR domain protein